MSVTRVCCLQPGIAYFNASLHLMCMYVQARVQKGYNASRAIAAEISVATRYTVACMQHRVGGPVSFHWLNLLAPSAWIDC